MEKPEQEPKHSDDSDEESDEDYIPSGHESVSEEENSGEDEDFTGQDNSSNTVKKRRKGKAKENGKELINPRNRGKSVSEENLELQKQIAEDVNKKKEEQEKSRADALWASFMSDVKPASKPKNTQTTKSSSDTPNLVNQKGNSVRNASDQKVKITQIFDFAGEEVRMEKEVDANSKEAKNGEVETAASSSTITPGSKRPGGLGAVLGYINKKQKINVLDKSKLDWEKYKSEANIGEDLANHNRGKNSYLEKKEFLERADHRQFEIERDFRLSKSSKR